ncbi:hypothetical protein ACVW0J_006056 [Bradyrhizobium sp. i1.7.7]
MGRPALGVSIATSATVSVLEAKQGSEADRAAVERDELDLDLFGQTAATRVKRGTARRGTPGWVKAMTQAKGQAERYAKALPADHGWPPFLLICDVGYCIEVYADFTRTGKTYTQFPDRSRFRIMLEDLRDEQVRNRLASIWTAPLSLDRSKEAQKVTREIGELLATVARRLEVRGHNPASTSAFPHAHFIYDVRGGHEPHPQGFIQRAA